MTCISDEHEIEEVRKSIRCQPIRHDEPVLAVLREIDQGSVRELTTERRTDWIGVDRLFRKIQLEAIRAAELGALDGVGRLSTLVDRRSALGEGDIRRCLEAHPSDERLEGRPIHGHQRFERRPFPPTPPQCHRHNAAKPDQSTQKRECRSNGGRLGRDHWGGIARGIAAVRIARAIGERDAEIKALRGEIQRLLRWVTA